MNTASPFVAISGGRSSRLPSAPAALPERFNWLETMLFATEPADVRRAAERYAGELLSRPVPPPAMAPAHAKGVRRPWPPE
jgi:hypothetical protein